MWFYSHSHWYPCHDIHVVTCRCKEYQGRSFKRSKWVLSREYHSLVAISREAAFRLRTRIGRTVLNHQRTPHECPCQFLAYLFWKCDERLRERAKPDNGVVKFKNWLLMLCFQSHDYVIFFSHPSQLPLGSRIGHSTIRSERMKIISSVAVIRIFLWINHTTSISKHDTSYE